MEKSFEPRSFEPKWTRYWAESGVFTARPRAGAESFCVVIPPPNITGRLHYGHGLNNTLIDVLTRWHRMRGHDALYLPGTDHASIGTHVMIERALEKEGITRQEMGREKFLERAWAWNREYGGAIRDQLRALGTSCDWTRERFTMDPGLSRAVREVFVRLHEEGLIYRENYMINWCPRCRTAVSDLEVVHKETASTLWTVSYPLEGGGEIQVATTRPETILGDVAIAVNPGDPRYASLVGRTAVVPVVGRRIPILADAMVDPAFGTGAVKITPAHDPADFEVGRRHSLQPIRVMDESARMTEAAGPYQGLDRFECRKRLVARLRDDGQLVGTRDHVSQVGHCDRCDAIVEPSISLQWFVKVAPLAGPAIRAVEEGRIEIVPALWTKTYREWMSNIHDWCISRQLWWGHRIPAWYCDRCPHITVAREDPKACGACGGAGLTQDPDILDTWFSSALWPFSTLGWPEPTADLARYYPTSVLITGYDIIFFWVAKMIMMGLKFMGEVPFRQVFFNGLVRDAQGRKMSKTKGNSVDFLDLIAEHGADPVRFTFTALSVPGADIPLANERILGYRAFCNKIWNAVRFAKIHLPEGGAVPPLPPAGEQSLADRWILSALDRATESANRALGQFRFDEAASSLYRFAWHELCDGYLEMSKAALTSDRPGPARAVLAHVLDSTLRLLHPIIPFVTEELWEQIPHDGECLATSAYPLPDPARRDAEAQRRVDFLIETATAIRNARAAAAVKPSARVGCVIVAPASTREELIEPVRAYLVTLARLSSLDVVTERPAGGTPSAIVGDAEIHVHAETPASKGADRARLERELQLLTGEAEPWAAKLGNAQFIEKARPEVVEIVTGSSSWRHIVAIPVHSVSP